MRATWDLTFRIMQPLSCSGVLPTTNSNCTGAAVAIWLSDINMVRIAEEADSILGRETETMR